MLPLRSLGNYIKYMVIFMPSFEKRQKKYPVGGVKKIKSNQNKIYYKANFESNHKHMLIYFAGTVKTPVFS